MLSINYSKTELIRLYRTGEKEIDVYSYETEKPKLFTEEYQVKFLAMRDKAKELLKLAGAFRITNVMQAGGSGEGWTLMACVDRLVELGDIREITDESYAGQDRIFVEGR